MKRNVGGSILPSSDPHILQPVETSAGTTLQVRAISTLDTHGLFLQNEAGESLLAMHPNGHSCYILLERMAAKNVAKVIQQVEYILACGGLARHVNHIVTSMDLNSLEGN